MLGCQHISSRYLRRFLSSTTAVKPSQTAVEHLKTSVDFAEVNCFASMANEWFNEDGPMKILHAFNRVRVPWIVEELKKHPARQVNDKQPLKGLKLLDVGSGCGILSFPLARLGAQVDGLDPSLDCVQMANVVKERLLSESCRKQVIFLNSTIETHCLNHSEAYDGIIVSEVVEHVADIPLFIQSCYNLAKPRALIFFSTINRTLLSRVVAAQLAELLGFVPKGTHDWNKFVKPDELTRILDDYRFRVVYSRGLVYDPLLNEWDWFFSDLINYALLARKN